MLPLTLLLTAIPAVTLSESHQAQTRVVVGQAFPQVEGLAEARGKKGTVVALPGSAGWMSKMLAEDLKNDFVKKYADRGVTFAVTDATDFGKKVTALKVDDKKLVELFGPAARPRVYVLDPEGKVVWFDVEYSLSTHRELHETLGELVAE